MCVLENISEMIIFVAIHYGSKEETTNMEYKP